MEQDVKAGGDLTDRMAIATLIAKATGTYFELPGSSRWGGPAWAMEAAAAVCGYLEGLQAAAKAKGESA